MRAAIIALMLTFASQAGAEIIDESFNIRGKKFYVYLIDGASGGCWTNLREVREYAEEKLQMRGAIVDDGWDKDGFTLKININAIRNPNADTQCFGNIDIAVMDMSYYASKRWALISNFAGTNLVNKNMNNAVLDRVNQALAEFN